MRGTKTIFESVILLGAMIALAGIALVGTTPLAMGQAATGTLTGQVSDAQGAVIPGATVKKRPISPSTPFPTRPSRGT